MIWTHWAILHFQCCHITTQIQSRFFSNFMLQRLMACTILMANIFHIMKTKMGFYKYLVSTAHFIMDPQKHCLDILLNVYIYLWNMLYQKTLPGYNGKIVLIKIMSLPQKTSSTLLSRLITKGDNFNRCFLHHVKISNYSSFLSYNNNSTVLSLTSALSISHQQQ